MEYISSRIESKGIVDFSVDLLRGLTRTLGPSIEFLESLAKEREGIAGLLGGIMRFLERMGNTLLDSLEALIKKIPLIGKIYAEIVWRLLGNRSGYTAEEINTLRAAKWLPAIAENISFFRRRFRVEMIKTNRCTVGFREGQSLYFDFNGMMITRKCPSAVCSHAIHAVSSALYVALDRMSRGSDPNDSQFAYVHCEDPGFNHKGMGNNLMKITFEKAPIWDILLYLVDNLPYLLLPSKNTRGHIEEGVEA